MFFSKPWESSLWNVNIKTDCASVSQPPREERSQWAPISKQMIGHRNICKLRITPISSHLLSNNSSPLNWLELSNNSPLISVQFSSVAQSCPTLCNPMNHSTPGLPVHHQLPEFTQTHVSWVSDAIQPSHPLSSPSPPAFNLSQHQGLFQWVSSSHQVAKGLEFQLQHQSFQ